MPKLVLFLPLMLLTTDRSIQEQKQTLLAHKEAPQRERGTVRWAMELESTDQI